MTKNSIFSLNFHFLLFLSFIVTTFAQICPKAPHGTLKNKENIVCIGIDGLGPFRPMRDLRMQWSQAFSFVCELALSLVALSSSFRRWTIDYLACCV